MNFDSEKSSLGKTFIDTLFDNELQHALPSSKIDASMKFDPARILLNNVEKYKKAKKGDIVQYQDPKKDKLPKQYRVLRVIYTPEPVKKDGKFVDSNTVARLYVADIQTGNQTWIDVPR